SLGERVTQDPPALVRRFRARVRAGDHIDVRRARRARLVLARDAIVLPMSFAVPPTFVIVSVSHPPTCQNVSVPSRAERGRSRRERRTPADRRRAVERSRSAPFPTRSNTRGKGTPPPACAHRSTLPIIDSRRD